MKFLKDNAVMIMLTVAVIGAGASLMTVSQNVYETQKNVKALDQDILAKQWDIRALKAELAYLSRPDRLEQISSAIAQSKPDGEAALMPYSAPVSYQLMDDLPPAMLLIPREKPKIAKFIKVKVEEPTTKQTPIIESAPKPAVKGQDFTSLLDQLEDNTQ